MVFTLFVTSNKIELRSITKSLIQRMILPSFLSFKKPLKIIVVIQYPLTNLFDTFYLECIKRKNISFSFVIIPSVQPGNTIYHSDLGDISDLMKLKKYPYINGINIKTGNYLDLKTLQPDIVFLQTPYDEQRASKLYSSEYLKSFTKVANISYGAIMIKHTGIYKDLINNNSFYNNTWKVFVENEDMKVLFDNLIPGKAVSIGYLKCDYFLNYLDKDDFPNRWSIPRKNSYRIIWKPRWVATIGYSTLFTYLYYFIDLVKNNPRIDFIWYMHPFIKSQVISSDLITQEELNSILYKISQISNFKIEEGADFLESIWSADLFIADASSTLVEYSLTGKPCIYTPVKLELNTFGKKLIKGMYIVNNSSQMSDKIKDLMEGKDTLKKIREHNKKIISRVDTEGRTVAQVMLSEIYKYL